MPGGSASVIVSPGSCTVRLCPAAWLTARANKPRADEIVIVIARRDAIAVASIAVREECCFGVNSFPDASRSCEEFEAPLQLNLGCIALSEALRGSSQRKILAVAYTIWSTILA